MDPRHPPRRSEDDELLAVRLASDDHFTNPRSYDPDRTLAELTAVGSDDEFGDDDGVEQADDSRPLKQDGGAEAAQADESQPRSKAQRRNKRRREHNKLADPVKAQHKKEITLYNECLREADEALSLIHI